VRSVVLRVVALALLLLLVLVTAITMRTLQRLPDATLYFVRADATSFTLEPVHRTLRSQDAGRGDDVASAAAVRAALEALVRGPSADEGARGLSTALPSGTAVRSVRVADGVATVDLSADFVTGGGTASMLARLHQVRYTALRPSGVEAVSLWVDGAPLTVLGGEGIMVESVWRPAAAALPRW